MGTYYVNKSGNDSNGGASISDAYLTIQAAVTAASGGTDTFNIGAGEYSEAVTASHTGHGIFVADGYVVLDGKGVHARAIAAYRNITMYRFVVRNFTTCAITVGGHYSYNYLGAFYNCRFENMPTVAIPGTSPIWIMEECQVYNISSYVFLGAWIDYYVTLKNNVFVDCGGIVSHANTYTPKIVADAGNIYYNVGTIYSLLNTPTFSHTHYQNTAESYGDNFYYSITNFGNIASTAHTTLSAWQAFAGSSRYQGADQVTNPQLVDVTKGVIQPKDTSPVIGASVFPNVHDGHIGPWELPYTFCSAYNSVSASSPAATWTVGTTASTTDGGSQWTGTGVSLNATVGDPAIGSLQGNGVLVSPVFDAGKLKFLKRISGVFGETYPLSVVDADNTDTVPNRKNVEYRVSFDSFVQSTSDVTLPWTKAEFDDDLGVTIPFKYVQFRVTLRSDGTAA